MPHPVDLTPRATAAGRLNATPPPVPRALVLLCGDLEGLGSGIDLLDVERWLRTTDAAVDIEVIPGLCDRPVSASTLGRHGVERLVLGLCSRLSPGAEVERSARSAGIDPLSIVTVPLGSYCALVHERADATAKAGALLAAALARARAVPASRPGDVVPRFARFDQHLSRRGLFTLPPIRYEPVAGVVTSRCASGIGCRRCVAVCPASALAFAGGTITVDRTRCEACGLCMVVCPRQAIQLPTYSADQLAAEVAALLGSAGMDPASPRAPLFVCRRNAASLAAIGEEGASYPASWLPVSVPCTGVIPAGLILGALAAGADAVGIIECGGECSFHQQQPVQDISAYCRSFLALLGASPERVRLLSGAPASALAAGLGEPVVRVPGHPGGVAGRARPLPRSAAAAVITLAGQYDAPAVTLEHQASPLGLVYVDSAACSGCGVCASSCPTGALQLFERSNEVALTFAPERCVGCGLCAGQCPEGAISVKNVTSLEALLAGEVRLFEDSTARCELCRSPVGPSAMLDRVAALLGDDATPALIEAITLRCAACRATGGRSRPRAEPTV